MIGVVVLGRVVAADVWRWRGIERDLIVWANGAVVLASYAKLLNDVRNPK